jgi:hypothetical protein
MILSRLFAQTFVPGSALYLCSGVRYMAVLLQEYSTKVVAPDGTTYAVLSYGEERADGTWTGWLEFEPTDATLPTLVTGQETSQPNRTSIEYWATGLEPVYFEGAFERAQ